MSSPFSRLPTRHIPNREEIMRFNTFIVLPAIAIAFSGCIYYDSEGNGHDCYDGDCAEGYGLEDGTEEARLAFAPDHVDVGSQFIGYLTEETGELDMNTVVDVQFYGDVAAAGWDSRENEVILSLTVDAEAVEGEVDVVVVFEDGGTAWLNGAFTILPTGDGEPNGGSEDGEGEGSASGDDSEDGPGTDDCDE
jgi:hypothetical protein